VAWRIAVSGKGGVGKTTTAGILGRLWGRDGRPTILVDCDPSTNLASALGIATDTRKERVPLACDHDLIEDRVGVRPGTGYGQMFRLNPEVEDILENYGVEGADGTKLLTLGTISGGGTGCFCPESALLKALMRHLVFKRDEIIIMDMAAGVEHLGRGTAERVDLMLIVVEPGARSVDTAIQIKGLGEDLGINRFAAVFNKVPEGADLSLLEERLLKEGIEVLGHMPFDGSLVEADMLDVSVMDHRPGSAVERSVAEMLPKIEALLASAS
jgi:CO dehydrogenase maturation factor